MDFRVWNGLAGRKTLVVLGAGASRGASFVQDNHYKARPPLDRDFFSEMQRIKLTSDVKKNVDRLLRFVRKEFGFNLTLSMEQFFSQVEATDNFHKEIKIGAGRRNDQYGRALEQFHRSLPILFRQAIGDNNCEYHEKLVTRLSSKDVILSFNYDCLIEKALQEKAKSRWNPGEGYGFPAQGNVKNWQSRKGITLLKPHGSLNWNIDAGAKVTTLEARPYDIRTAKGRIIPPTWFKNIEKYPYEDVWKRARYEIRECEALIVIGYSIPLTDLFSRILFRTDIKTIEFLVIANPNFSDRQKFLNLIKDKMARNARIVEFDNLEKLAKSLSP